MARIETPNFVQAWIKDLSDEVNDRWYRIVPIWFALFFIPAGAAAYFIPVSFWVDKKGDLLGNASLVYSAILTLNGIIVALSWSAFGKIYEMIGAGRFSVFLQENAVLDAYLFLVRYVQVFQMLAMISSVSALLAAQFPQVPMVAQRALLAAMLGFAAYAIKQASSAVGVMQDLVRYRAAFDAADSQQPKGSLRAV